MLPKATCIVSLQNRYEQRIYHSVKEAFDYERPANKTMSKRLQDVIDNSQKLYLRYNTTVGWGAHRLRYSVVVGTHTT